LQSARAIKEKNLKLQTEFPENMPAIRGDSKKLFHALSYLLDNVIKFSPEGSTISIAARQEQGSLCISISFPYRFATDNSGRQFVLSG
jgi:signal transduction histidine kinase